MKNIYIKTILVCCLTLFLACEGGEDGANGLDGIDGIDGTDGMDGSDGIDGETDEIYAELSKYGSINLTIEGTRIDDVPFTTTTEFKFTPTMITNSWDGDVSDSNLVFFNEDETVFSLGRFLSTPGEDVPYSALYFIVSDPGEETESYDFELEVGNYAVITDDLQYFVLDESFEDGDNIENFEITNYSFDETTNNLVLSFTFEVLGENNDTGNDMTVSGEVDVIVVEEYETPTT